jgi:hypothetical protein
MMHDITKITTPPTATFYEQKNHENYADYYNKNFNKHFKIISGSYTSLNQLIEQLSINELKIFLFNVITRDYQTFFNNLKRNF